MSKQRTINLGNNTLVFVTMNKVPDGFDAKTVVMNISVELNNGMLIFGGLPPEYYDPAYKGQWELVGYVRYETEYGENQHDNPVR